MLVVEILSSASLIGIIEVLNTGGPVTLSVS